MMPSLTGSAAAILSCLLAAAPAGAQSPAARFAPIDVDGDGEPEVLSAEPLGAHGDPTAPAVLVLIERRLLSPRGAAPDRAMGQQQAALREKLQRLGRDLAAAGYFATLLSIEVYSGPRHQDGRTVLGMRRLLQAHAARCDLAGALLVGHFPDATLVRTCNWRRKGKVSLPGPDGETIDFGADTRWLRRVPELVAHKFDLVLADLDGHWEDRYIGGPTPLERVEAVFTDAEGLQAGGPCAGLRVRAPSHEDVFHVADGAVEVRADEFAVAIEDGDRDHECTESDRASPNGLARPDISISRIDARGAAWSPKPEYLGADGLPRRVAFDTDTAMPRWDHAWQPDPALELQLLAEYLDRNHAYRTVGIRPEAHKPASIAWGLGSGMRSVKRGAASWAEFAEPGYDVHRDVDLLQFVAWLRRPALLRTLRAHSNGRYAAFAKTDTTALTAAIDGTPWSFSKRGAALVPSLASACRAGHADFFLYRTLWANDALPRDPYLLIHTGCEALSPPNHKRSYDDAAYGARQHAESMLFFTPCLAIVGRAKVFYDEPLGFSETLRDGGNVGDAWRRYVAVDASAPTWGKAGGDIGRKRTYFWSVLGDWTLQLRQ